MSNFHIGSYLKHIGLCEKISIYEKIQDYKRKYDKRPLIVIDAMYYDQLGGYLSSDTATKMNDLCGISRARLQLLENFVAKLTEWGADLVFITNGAFVDTGARIVPEEDDQSRSTKDWHSTKDWRYSVSCAIIDYLRDTHYHQVARDAKFIPIERIWTESTMKIARKYGKIFCAWDNTRQQEIAKYASLHEAMAIISKNYILLLFCGLSFPRYKMWSTIDCCLKAMTTMEFDPIAVRRTLSISTKQTRLLAVLCDYYFQTSTLGDFFDRMSLDGNVRLLVFTLTKYIKQVAGNLQEMDYLKIARDIFGEDKYIEKFDDFKTACESYNLTKITLSSDQNNDAVSTQLKKQDTFNYDIYHGITFCCSVTFVDYRYWQQRGVDFFQVMMSLYRRMSGVILQHKKDPSLMRTVMIKPSHDDSFSRQDFDPEYPTDFFVPSLEHMFRFAAENSKTVPELSINILEFITEMSCNADMLEFFCCTDQRFWLQDCVTLRYMVMHNMIETYEADILVLVMHKCRRQRFTNAPELPNRLNIHAFHLYFMYLKMRTVIKHCLYTAGFNSSYMDECYLDGVEFQNEYQRWDQDYESEQFREEIARIYKYRLY